MIEVKCTLTVYFEDPFWVGVFERNENNGLSVSKVTFGAEPKTYDVCEFILNKYYSLTFSPVVENSERPIKRNPKKMQREVKDIITGSGIGTKAQQALKLQYEQNKRERVVKTKAEKLAEAERLYELKQQKKKEKHRGR